MKKTTADFVNASPAQKEVMINDGLRYLAEHFNDSISNMKKLSNWVKMYGALVVVDEIIPKNKPETVKKLDALNESIDELIDTVMVLSVRVNGTRKRILL